MATLVSAGSAGLPEENVLGCLFFNPSAMTELQTLLMGDDFEIVKLKTIYQLMVAQYNSTDREGRVLHNFDTTSIASELEQMGLLTEYGGESYLRSLINSASRGPDNYRLYAKQITDAANKRRARSIGVYLSEQANKTQDVNSLVSSVTEDLLRLQEEAQDVPLLSFRDLAEGNREAFKERLSHPSDLVGLSTGFPRLDWALGGLCPSMLIGLYGATSSGKSSLAVSLTTSLLKQGNVLIISTESPPNLWFNKLVSALTRIPNRAIRGGDVNEEEQIAIHEAYDYLANLDGLMLDIGSPTVAQVAAITRKAKREKDIIAVIIDSVSKFRVPGVSDTYITAKLNADGLLDLARESELPIFSTVQQKPDVGSRVSKIARIEDAVGGAAFGQDADVILSLYNHQYYIDLGLAEPDVNYPKDTAYLRVTKNRWDEARTIGVRLDYVNRSAYVESADQSFEKGDHPF